MAKSIDVVVTGNAAPLRKALSEASNDLNGFGNKAGASMKKLGIAMLATGTAAGAMAVKFAHAAESEQVANARLEQVAISMGLFGIETSKTTKRLETLAQKTALQTGLDEDQIKTTMAKLLTFRQLAKTADVVGGAFDRATQAAIDMAAAGFGEATTNAVQLGKALEDPIKGINSLRRSGITFTQAEKDKIKVLVESNRISEAQRMILKAVETQVGGVALATATASGKIKASYQVISEELGKQLLPFLDKAAKALTAFAAAAADKGTAAGVSALGKSLADTGHHLDGSVNGFGRLTNAFIRAGDVSIGAANAVIPWINALTNADIKGIKHADTLKTYTDEQRKAALATRGLTEMLSGQIATTTAVITTQEQLNNVMGPVASRNLEDFKAYHTSYLQAIIDGQARIAAANEAAKQKEADRWKSFKDNLKSAQDAIRTYVAGIASAISANVSLSSSFSQASTEQADATSGLNSALSDRKAAYEALDQASQSRDIVAYNKALQDVADTEAAVTKAKEVKPKDYTAIFREQIQAAKDFSGYLQTLISGGQMSPAAVQQLLDLGPVAGAMVAKDLIAGTGGFTAASLSSSLAEVSAAGTAAGMATPGFGKALKAKAVDGIGPGNYYITVNAGVGDKAEIGKEVVAALQAYEKRIGKLPIKVS